MVLRVEVENLNWGGFSDWISTQIISKWQHVSLIQKSGNIPIQISSQILKPLFCLLLSSCTIWGNGGTIAHLPHGFTSTT